MSLSVFYFNTVDFFFAFRYFLQHHPEAEDPFLHGELDRAVRRHFLFVGSGVLSAGRLWGEDRPQHLDPFVPDHVFLAHIRDYTIDLTGPAPARQIFAIHHASGRPQRRHHHNHIERTLQEAEHTQDGPVG